MTFDLRIGRLALSLELTLGEPEPEPEPDVEVVFLNPEEDTREAREFIDSLHRDLGSYNQ